MMMLLFVFACGSSPEAPPPAPAPATDAAPPAAPPATAHGAGGGHMADMAATRDGLRADLGAAYDAEVPGLTAADATRGKATYETHCASCHGALGKGDGPAATGLTPPPADFTDAFHARYYSDAGRVRIIEKGLPGTAMAPFGGQLDTQQILDVYAHVRSLRDVPAGKAAGDDHAGHEH